MKKKILGLLCVMTISAICAANDIAPTKPLMPQSVEWRMNDYCEQRKIGDQDFYVAASGPWTFNGAKYAKMRSLGLDRIITSGWFYPWPFDPTTKKNAYYQTITHLLKQNEWPFFSICYHANRTDAKPLTEAAVKGAGELWVGDGHPEYCYRFEHFLPAVRGERSTWLPPSFNNRVKYLKKHAIPILEKELPFYNDKKHKWTREDYYRLSKIQCDVIYKEVGLNNALPWGMNGLGFYYVASQPGNRAVADKTAKYFANARCRGAMRQFGGDKFWIIWRGFEPLKTLSLQTSMARFQPEEMGYPASHNRIYLYEPYLSGANYYINELSPDNLIDDVENDGKYELSPLGHVFMEMIDFTKRHPKRGTAYAPVALMMDWKMTEPKERGTSYGNYLPFEDSDQMNYDLLFEHLFPELPEQGRSYFSTTPFGNIFDIIKPNVPGKGVDPKALKNYKVLFALAGLKIDDDLANKIKERVKNGGSFIVNAMDCDKNLTPDFLGLEITSETIESTTVKSKLDGKTFTEKPFLLRKLKLKGADSIYVDGQGKPVVTKFKYGKGYVFVVAAEYMLEKNGVKKTGTRFKKKALLSFSNDFLDHLFSGLLPIEVIIPRDSRADIGWSIAKKGEGWVVNLINYSYKREPAKLVKHGTAYVVATYPGKKVSVKLRCRVTVRDALEWIEDKNVEWRPDGNGGTVIETNLPSGEIKVIEIQPEKIKLEPVRRYVNHAFERPVKITSSAKGHPGSALVDGDLSRDNGWWSNKKETRHKFALPQIAIVCLEEERMIDHIKIWLYHWKHERIEKYARSRFTRFHVETSLDGKKWEMAFDESKNIKTSFSAPLERWFAPRKTMYVKLTVTYNSMNAGAQIIELKVFGAEKELVPIIRKPANPGKIAFPIDLKTIPSSKIVYLTDTPRVSAKTDYLPVGKTIEEMAGDVTLKATQDDDGAIYEKSLYAQSNSEYVYKLNGRYKHFLAVAGLGAIKPTGCTVRFKVFADGNLKYDSGVFKKGDYPKAVFANLADAKTLRLVVEDASDGIRNDYAWWGEARLIKK